MEGEIGLCISRRPDFFALNRLEGDRWRVGVLHGPDGTAAGCVAMAERDVDVHGWLVPAMYVSDFEAHPDHRGGPAADALCEYARDVCIATGGDSAPTSSPSWPETVHAGPSERAPRSAQHAPFRHRPSTLGQPPRSSPGAARRRRLGGSLAGLEDIEEMAALGGNGSPRQA